MFTKFKKSRAVYEVMWKNNVQPDRPQLTIFRRHIVCWIPRCTKTYSECAVLIAFLLQQWLHERASMLRYTCIVCLVIHAKRECQTCLELRV